MVLGLRRGYPLSVRRYFTLPPRAVTAVSVFSFFVFLLCWGGWGGRKLKFTAEFTTLPRFFMKCPVFPPGTYRKCTVTAIILLYQVRYYTCMHVVRMPFFFFFFAHFYFPASGQAVVTGVLPSPPRFLPQFLSRIGFSNPTARRLFIESC